MFDTPVLLMAWRRPHLTKKVLDALRVVAPTRMFVSCDGPNLARPDEVHKVVVTREVLEREIDWPGTLQRRYSEVNQGCRLAVSNAITWFFEQVEEGIILEDDCVPHPAFFPYCVELLDRYRHDTRVWCISGNNFQDGQWRGDGSYYFSRYIHVWGWATWRRCWQQYDSELKRWPALKASGFLDSLFEDPLERGYWSSILDRLMLEGKPDTWDYQWTFTCLVNGGLAALPNLNLVSNIGRGPGATHTTREREPTKFGEGRLLPLRHPSFVLRDGAADRYDFDHRFKGAAMRREQQFLNRLRARLRRHEWLKGANS